MKQYFEENDQLIDDVKELDFNYYGTKLTFKTNSGLFSKDEIDEFSIKMIEQVANENVESILDLGCGYGFVGIVMAKKYPKARVDFIDVNKRACEYTKINCELNKLESYRIINSDGIENPDKYNLILLNPPIHAGKDIVYKLYKQAIEHLNQLGSLYIVIHKKHGANSSVDYLKTLNDNVVIKYKKKGLFVIEITK